MSHPLNSRGRGTSSVVHAGIECVWLGVIHVPLPGEGEHRSPQSAEAVHCSRIPPSSAPYPRLWPDSSFPDWPWRPSAAVSSAPCPVPLLQPPARSRCPLAGSSSHESQFPRSDGRDVSGREVDKRKLTAARPEGVQCEENSKQGARRDERKAGLTSRRSRASVLERS